MQLTHDGLVQLPFPNQIPIRKGTLDAVLKDNIRIQVDLSIDKDGETGELIYSTNSGLLQKSGFETASPEGKTIENWFFTNLSPDQGETTMVEANSDQSKQLFTASIFARRMNQARDNGYLGELHRAYDVLPEETKLAEQMYERLVSDGTKFWMLTGGTDRKQIYDAVRAVAQP